MISAITNYSKWYKNTEAEVYINGLLHVEVNPDSCEMLSSGASAFDTHVFFSYACFDWKFLTFHKCKLEFDSYL